MAEATKKNPLLKKKRREGTFTAYLGDDASDSVEIKLRALSKLELDNLQSKYPPTKEQRAEGETLNSDEFAPALFSACAIEPTFTLDEAREIWADPDWSAGELLSMYAACYRLCTTGVDIPHFANV